MSIKKAQHFTGTRTQIDEIAKRDYITACSLLGHALCRWAVLESELAFLYAITMRGKSLLPAIESFYTVTSYSGKLKLIDSAICVQFDDVTEILSEWKPLLKKLDGTASKRNELAHGRIISLIHNENDKCHYSGTYLIPYYGALRANQGLHLHDDKKLIQSLKKRDRVTDAEINRRAKLFDSRTDEVNAFCWNVSKLTHS